MKGVIFNLLEGFITDGWGEETYDAILSRCPLHTKEPFIGPGTYPDADLFAIVGKTTEKLGIPVADALHAFGKYCFPRLAERFPVFVQGHTHPKSFLKTIDTVIHVEVRKLFKGAVTPRITFVDPGPDALVLRYESTRKVCALMTGLLAGAGEYFATPMSWDETQCTSHGADACEFHISFPATAR
ncbi:MAG: heme NO-binding domain-containing protein [Labilithrix sp.]|nr:heme NO-binding domain-containing protein [Labilithrix sp.]